MSEERVFCARCGNAIAPGSAFCNRCGAPVGPSAQPAQPAPMAEVHEKQEKHEKYEKQEKREKGEKHEKGGRGSLAGPVTGGLVLVWLGVTFYLASTGRVAWEDWWSLFLMGLGAILIFEGFVMYAERRIAFPGPFIGGVVLFVVGLTFYTGFQYGDIWPLFLIAAGVAVLVAAAFGRRRVPSP